MQPINNKLVENLRRQNLGGKLLDDGTLRYIVFLNPVQMRPIRRTQRESILKTVGRRARSFDVVINGNYFAADFFTKSQAYSGTVTDPSDIKIEGQVVLGGKVIAGNSQPDRFYIAEVMSTMRRTKRDPAWHYEVGRGNPKANSKTVAAVGNLGPLVDDGLRYGIGNKYRPPARGPAQGDPGPRLRPSLTRRNDGTFKSVEDPDTRVGKTIIAWSPNANALLVGVEADHDTNPKRPGVSYSRLVAQLSSAGFTEAVFCDGSDSSMLWHRGKLIIAPGEAKANMMNLCIGFRQVPGAAPKQTKQKR
jgi:hypothetical protein